MRSRSNFNMRAISIGPWEESGSRPPMNSGNTRIQLFTTKPWPRPTCRLRNKWWSSLQVTIWIPQPRHFRAPFARPMAAGSDAVPRAGEAQAFAVQPFIGPAALKDNLERIFTGAIDHGPPALVFSGSHGKAFGPDLPEPQAESQGAIICNDWPGFGCKFTREHYFDASDLANAECRTHGMIHFLFACYGGGWPIMDTFSRGSGTPKMIAQRPMLARLPQVLLSHRNGGALAVLGHIDRAWAYSFRDGSNPQIQGFSDVIARIMWGDSLGSGDGSIQYALGQSLARPRGNAGQGAERADGEPEDPR